MTQAILKVQNLAEARQYVHGLLAEAGYRDIREVWLNNKRHFGVGGWADGFYHKWAGTYESDFFWTGWRLHKHKIPPEFITEWKGPWVSCRVDCLDVYSTPEWGVKEFLLVYSDGKVYALDPLSWLTRSVSKYNFIHKQEKTGEVLADAPVKWFHRWDLEAKRVGD